MSELDEIRAELRRIADAIAKVIDLLPVATEHRDRLVDRHGALVGLADEIGEALGRREAQRVRNVAPALSDAEFDAALQSVETRIQAERRARIAARMRMG